MDRPVVSVARETAAALWPEIQPLILRHWEEIAHFKDIPLSPNKAAYDRLEAAGILRCFAARYAGSLIGYLVATVVPGLHYSGSLFAYQDVLFVLPEHRKTRAGLSLLRFAERSLREEGVQVLHQHMKVAHDFGPLLERLGYEFIEKIYVKRLDHGR